MESSQSSANRKTHGCKQGSYLEGKQENSKNKTNLKKIEGIKWQR